MEIKNLKKAADRILKAIKLKETIILYGDADLDGTTAVIILKESIVSLGGKDIIVYFPDREIDGYGVTKTGLDFLKDKILKEKGIKRLPKVLLIAIDCGIGNFKEMKIARKMGFSSIILDHHEVLDAIPEADIVVDPKQKGDKYQFKGFSAAGIVFKLAESLFKGKMGNNLRQSFIELTMLSTIADMMPKEEDNQAFIDEGMGLIENSWRPGVKIFFEPYLLKESSSISQKVSEIISILNVRDVQDGMPASYRLLIISSLDDAREMVKKLIEGYKIRKERIQNLVSEVNANILEEEPIVFAGGTFFDFTLISAVASVVSRETKKPAFIYKELEKESQGTVRSPAGINTVLLMKKCSKLLITYGGHPQASGFRVKNSNLKKFKQCLIKNLKNT